MSLLYKRAGSQRRNGTGLQFPSSHLSQRVLQSPFLMWLLLQRGCISRDEHIAVYWLA